jgi:hypothetical protein
MKTVHSPQAESIGLGAPANENEITPAMIAAGVSALLDFDSRFERESDAVISIFEAMVAAKEAIYHMPASELISPSQPRAHGT